MQDVRLSLHRIGRNRTLTLGVLLLFVAAAWPAPEVGAGELEDVVARYLQAKKERANLSRQGGRRKGRQQKTPTPIEPLLLRIAGLNSEASLKFLRREYADPDPFIASASGAAILETKHENAAQLVIKGYNRGGRWNVQAKVKVLDALATCSDPAGLEFVLKLAQKGDVESQAVAMGSLALRPKLKKALLGILPALGHRAYEVRNAALRGIRSFRFKDMIAPLIERLDREKEEKLRVDVLQILVDLTGVNMGLEVKDWKKWWEASRETFAFSKAGAGKTRVVAHDLKYFGIEVASKRVSFLVDASNSMLRGPNEAKGKGKKRKGRGKGQPGDGKRKIDILKTELTRILRELPADTRINILFFHKICLPWKKELHSLRGAGRTQAIAFVQNLTCAWGTNIYDTLELALKDRRVDTLFLLSDGRPVGGKYDRPADILKEIGAINRVRGATINCISFGKETEFLKKLAAQNNGVYRTTSGK